MIEYFTFVPFVERGEKQCAVNYLGRLFPGLVFIYTEIAQGPEGQDGRVLACLEAEDQTKDGKTTTADKVIQAVSKSFLAYTVETPEQALEKAQRWGISNVELQDGVLVFIESDYPMI